jgi:hypothetical protein
MNVFYCSICGSPDHFTGWCPDKPKRPVAQQPPAQADTKTIAPDASALDRQEGGDHYQKLKIQPIEYIHANGIPFAEGCVIKYVSRWRNKGGLNDLEKARHFIDLLIELELKNA